MKVASLTQSPLRLPAFRRLWFGLVISRLGDQFTVIALLWFVLDLTGSGTALSVVLLCFSLPAIFTSPLLGRLLDRYQPRKIMLLDNLARGLVIGAIPVLYWLDGLTLWTLYGLALLAGALAPATSVGVGVILPHLVEDAELEQANGWASVSVQFAALAGPALAGLLIAGIGGPPVMLIDAVSFWGMAFLLCGLPPIARTPTVDAVTTHRHWWGFGVLLQLKPVRIITALSAVFFLAYGPLEPALPLYSRDVLRAGAAGYGLLWSGFGAGALLGLLAIPLAIRYPRPGVTFAVIAILWGLLLAPLVLLTNLPLAMLFLGLAGCAWAPYATVETSLVQRLTPAHLRGQVFGARGTVLVAATPLGVLIGGLLLAKLSAPAVIGISALACIVAGGGGLLSSTLRSITRGGEQGNAMPEADTQELPPRPNVP